VIINNTNQVFHICVGLHLTDDFWYFYARWTILNANTYYSLSRQTANNRTHHPTFQHTLYVICTQGFLFDITLTLASTGYVDKTTHWKNS
jgi:hypothetical protein